MKMYETEFKLTYPVNNFIIAKDYLVEYDMTEFLKNHLNYYNPYPNLDNKIAHIEWELTSDDEGKVVLTSITELTEHELECISEWVRGQCSDGIGEGFEQQEFAYVWDDWDDEDEDCEPEPCAYASFDWKTNPYTFTEIEVNV